MTANSPPAFQAIRKKYVYNHKHDSTSFAAIINELDGADMVCCLQDALITSNLGRGGAVNAVILLTSSNA